MLTNEPDEDWKRFGESDPYFAVLTEPEYRRGRMSDADRERFFQSGAEHVAKVFTVIRGRLDAAFAPQTALDFGCGVGRILIPLARVCPSVTGVDVSEAMLAEARSNMEKAGLAPAELVLSDDDLTGASGKFDFVHSHIVLQHIPVERGERIIAGLVDRVADGGCAVIHVTYSHPMPARNRMLYWARVRVPGAHKLLNVALGRSPSAPLMQGNDYSLTRVIDIISRRGCGEIHIRFSDHHGNRGVLLFCRKTPAELF